MQKWLQDRELLLPHRLQAVQHLAILVAVRVEDPNEKVHSPIINTLLWLIYFLLGFALFFRLYYFLVSMELFSR